jgi:uncharacterized protein YdhG (YjbR/CyaY superfamily)
MTRRSTTRQARGGTARRKPATFATYLRGLPVAQRRALQRLRAIIHRAAPGAEEGVSYGLPSFRLEGRALVALGATRRHCAFYPMSSETIERFRGELTSFDTARGTIRFQPERPLPERLVRRLVRARLEEHALAAERRTRR